MTGSPFLVLKGFPERPDSPQVMTLAETWQSLGKRLAVIAGASTALVCLLAHNSLLAASIRGALALAGGLVLVRLGHVVIVAFGQSATAKPATKEAPTARRTP